MGRAMDADDEPTPAPLIAERAESAKIPHPLIQYGRIAARKGSPLQSPPRPGYLRGVDFYSAAVFPSVIVTATAQFLEVHGRFPDIVSPERYSDKIFWAKFFRPLKVPETGNKLLTASFIPAEARDLVRCPPIVWQSRLPRVPRAGEIEPGTYYLKTNHGADRYRRVSYPIKDEEAEALDAEFARHLAKEYNWWRGEWWYNVFPRELLLEPAIGSAEYTTSWNFLVIAGEIELVIAYQKLGGGASRKSYFTPAFDPLPDQDDTPPAVTELPSAKARKRMSAAARAIGAPLGFVRVDFLLDDEDEPYLGELSFAPGNAVARLTDELDWKLGLAWDLSAEPS
jgi:hypothetical protein